MNTKTIDKYVIYFSVQKINGLMQIINFSKINGHFIQSQTNVRTACYWKKYKLQSVFAR